MTYIIYLMNAASYFQSVFWNAGGCCIEANLRRVKYNESIVWCSGKLGSKKGKGWLTRSHPGLSIAVPPKRFMKFVV